MAQIAKTSEQIGDRGPAIDSSVGSSTAGIQVLPEAGPTNRVYRWDKLKNALGKFLIQRKLQNYNPSPDVLAQAFEGLLLEEQSALNLAYLVHAPYLIPGKTINQEDEKILRNFHDGALELMADYVHNLAFHLPMNRGINRKIKNSPPRQKSQQKKLPSPPADTPPSSLSPPAPVIQPLVRETTRSSTSNKQYYEWGRLKDEVGKALSAHCKLTGLTPTYDHLCGAFQSLSKNEQLMVNAIYKVYRPHPIAGEDFPAKREVAFRKSCQAITVKMAEHIRDIIYQRITQPHEGKSNPQPARLLERKQGARVQANPPHAKSVETTAQHPKKDPTSPTARVQESDTTKTPLLLLPAPASVDTPKDPAPAPSAAPRTTAADIGETSPDPEERAPEKNWVERVKTLRLDNEASIQEALQHISLEKIRRNFGELAEKLTSADQLMPFFKNLKRASRQAQIFLLRFGNFKVGLARIAEEFGVAPGTIRAQTWTIKKRLASYLETLTAALDETAPEDLVPAPPPETIAGLEQTPLAIQKEFIRVANELDTKISLLIWLLFSNSSSQEKPKEENPPDKGELAIKTPLEIFHEFGIPVLRGKTRSILLLKSKAFRLNLAHVPTPEDIDQWFLKLTFMRRDFLTAVFVKGKTRSSIGEKHGIVTTGGVTYQINEAIKLLNAALEKSAVQPESP